MKTFTEWLAFYVGMTMDEYCKLDYLEQAFYILSYEQYTEMDFD